MTNTPIDELVSQALSDTMPNYAGGPINELRRQRWQRIEQARAIVDAALHQARAMTPEEDANTVELIREAQELSPAIEELQDRSRRMLARLDETVRAMPNSASAALGSGQ